MVAMETGYPKDDRQHLFIVLLCEASLRNRYWEVPDHNTLCSKKRKSDKRLQEVRGGQLSAGMAARLVLRPCHPYWGTRRHHFFIQEGAKGYDPIWSSFPRSPGAGPPNCRGFGGDELTSAGNTTLQALRGCTAEPKCIPRLSSSWRWGGGWSKATDPSPPRSGV